MQEFVIWIDIASLFIETEDIYKDIVEDGERRFDTSSFELDR